MGEEEAGQIRRIAEASGSKTQGKKHDEVPTRLRPRRQSSSVRRSPRVVAGGLAIGAAGDFSWASGSTLLRRGHPNSKVLTNCKEGWHRER